MGTTLVKNGTVVTAADRYQADIYIDKGVITLLGQGLNLPYDVPANEYMNFGGQKASKSAGVGTTVIDRMIRQHGGQAQREERRTVNHAGRTRRQLPEFRFPGARPLVTGR